MEQGGPPRLPDTLIGIALISEKRNATWPDTARRGWLSCPAVRSLRGPAEDTPTLDRASGAATASPPSLPARWRLQREIGRGGQAEVWLASDLELDTLVAIKIFRAELTATQRERLRREVLLGRTLQHAGLVRVYELIDGGDRLAVAMEWVPEGSLAQRLEAGALPVDEVIRVAGQVLEVLAYLHGQQIVHRDIKPSNLLVDSEGRVRLADLGLARPLDDDRGLTKTMASVGTPAYMSPEQIRGDEPAPAADLYGLGVTLYQLVTGALPFSGTSEFDVANKHLTVAVDDPRKRRPGCPAWLAGFVLRLLEKRPRDRFKSAAIALDALRRRQVLVSPRSLRRAATAAVVVAATAAAGVVAARFARPAVPESLTVTGSTLAARDSHGRTLWEKTYVGYSPMAVVGDFIGDAAPEVAVGLGVTNGQPASAQDLIVLDSGGRQQARFASAESLVGPPNDGFSDLLEGARPFAADLDGDNRPELLWRTSHRLWYPTLIGAWNPRAGVAPSVLLINSGHVHTLRGADLDGDGAEELVLVGQNNPLGWQLVVAILSPHRGPASAYGSGSSPDLLFPWTSSILSGNGALVSYTPLGPRGGGDMLVDAGRAGLTLRVNGRTVRLDIGGNPEGSPLFGKGPGPRKALWDELVILCKEIEAGRAQERVAVLLTRHAEALGEAPMRLATDLLLARSLAVSGDHGRAIALLRAGLARTPNDSDLRLRLGEQLAIAGERRAAMTELSRAAQIHTLGRNPYDASGAWMAVAALEADAGEMERLLAFVRAANSEGSGDVALGRAFAALWAFLRGDWRDDALRPREALIDMPVVSVLTRWAELELGAAPGVVAAAAEAVAANPEARDVAHLLEAHALLRAGQAAEAHSLAVSALTSLQRRSRTDVPSVAWLALAHHVTGGAAAALGDGAAADEHYRQAARIAPKCWFGTRPATP